MTATHFITAKTFHRKRLFQNQRYGDAFTLALMRWRESHDLLLHDYVIMPDHVHLLVSVPTDSPTAQIESLQKAFAAELRQQYGYDGRIWDEQFRDENVSSVEECEQATRMIHSNPVRVGFCDTPGQYRMSSISSRWVLDPLPEKLQSAVVAKN